MMRSKIWLNVLIMRLAIVVLMQIYFQGCLSNLDMQTNLSVEIQRLISGISGIRTGSGNHYVRLYDYKFPEKIFSEERSEVYWAGGLWQSISGLPVDDSKIFFQEYLFQKLLQCIAYIMKWI